MVLVWTALVMLVMTGSMTEVAAICQCNPSGLCKGNNLHEIATATEAATITLLSCDNLADQTVPSSIGLLTKLSILSLPFSFLTGSLPSEVGLLIELERLNVQNSEFSGTIPSEFGKLTQLQFLNMRENDFTGTIPSELGNLDQLTTLDLSRNDLTGAIPLELGNLTKVETLFVAFGNAGLCQPLELSLPFSVISNDIGNAAVCAPDNCLVDYSKCNRDTGAGDECCGECIGSKFGKRCVTKQADPCAPIGLQGNFQSLNKKALKKQCKKTKTNRLGGLVNKKGSKWEKAAKTCKMKKGKCILRPKRTKFFLASNP